MCCQEAVSSGQEVTSGSVGLRGVLDTLSIAVLLLDRNSEVLLANRAAESLIADRDWLNVTNKKLCCYPQIQAELEKHVRLVADDQATNLDNILHVASREGRDGLLLAFSAQEARETSHVSHDVSDHNRSNIVVCVAVDPNRAAAINAEWLRRVYPLTDAEAKIAAYLANGLDYTEIARERNVTVSTVRSYSKSIFKKLRVNSRAEVVRKVLSLSIPLSVSI